MVTKRDQTHALNSDLSTDAAGAARPARTTPTTNSKYPDCYIADTGLTAKTWINSFLPIRRINVNDGAEAHNLIAPRWLSVGQANTGVTSRAV
jgi:hypothetical protein